MNLDIYVMSRFKTCPPSAAPGKKEDATEAEIEERKPRHLKLSDLTYLHNIRRLTHPPPPTYNAGNGRD